MKRNRMEKIFVRAKVINNQKFFTLCVENHPFASHFIDKKSLEIANKLKWFERNVGKYIQVCISRNINGDYGLTPTYFETIIRCPKCGCFWNPVKGGCVCKKRRIR